MSTVRTFIAIELPNSLQEQLATIQDELRSFGERISWTKPGNIHLTLKFLGNVEEHRILAIGGALTGALSEQRAFGCSANSLGAFPNLRRARVLWVGLRNDSGELATIAKIVDEALNPLGFSKEKRKFTPHLTLGRVKSRLGGTFIQRFSEMKFDETDVLVNEIVLMKSTLKPTGSIYTPLHKVRLKGL